MRAEVSMKKINRWAALLLVVQFSAYLAAQAPAPTQTPVAPASATKPQSPTTPPAAKPASPPAAQTPAPAVATPPAVVPPPPPIPSPQPPQPNIPAAQLIWSVVLNNDVPNPLPAVAAAVSQRSAVLAGDRVVAVYEVSSEISRAGRPLNTYRLVSMDVLNGEIKVQKDLQGQTLPALYASDDGHIVLEQTGLTRINPDLSESGEKLSSESFAHRRSLLISPDGATLAYWAEGTTVFLDAHTLTPSGVRIRGPVPTSVSHQAIVTSDPVWSSQFPRDTAFITRLDARSPRLLYHGACVGHPFFLAEDKILSISCGKVRITDIAGKLLKELPLGAQFGEFAGVSRDGQRFAIESSDYSATDPSFNASELFVIYDAGSFEPVATVTPDSLPEARSWSALAQDGHTFLCGGPQKLSLYRIP
jgi:hypothetical protein